MTQQPTIGRIVLYVMGAFDLHGDDSRNVGVEVPAMVTHARMGNDDVDLILYPPAERFTVLNQHKGSVTYDETGKPGTWHWPARGAEPVVPGKEQEQLNRVQAAAQEGFSGGPKHKD